MRREDDLRAAMQLLAVDPPTVEDVIRVVSPSREKRRRRVWILPVAAATVTLAVVLTVTALVSSGHSAQQPPLVKQPAPDVSALVGVHWRLLTFPGDSAAPTPGRSSLFIGRDGHATVKFRCGYWAGNAELGDGRAVFSGATNGGSKYCGIPVRNEGKALVATDSILDGAVRWSLHNRLLTITKPGKGSMTYLPASIAATITGRLLAIGGPAQPAGRPLAGTVTVTSNGGKPLTLTVGSSGRYSITVAPGTYQVQGHSPLYQDGKWPCRALKPADAAARTTTTVNVYCQEK
jgi:hypothetical protein